MKTIKNTIIMVLLVTLLTSCNNVIVWSVGDVILAAIIAIVALFILGVYIIGKIQDVWKRIKSKF